MTMTTSSATHETHNGQSHTKEQCSAEPPTPYWNMNLPPHLHTKTCPPYLRNLSEKDVDHLHLPDSEYTPFSFSQIRDLITTNNLQSFTRLPADLHRYRKFVYDLTRDHGSVETYMLEQLLGWDAKQLLNRREVDGLNEIERGFESKDNYRILKNDWPYGVEAGIQHMVVWTKFSLGGEEQGEDNGRAAIEHFMEDHFYPHILRENVVWFRNWGALKSVHAVEHFHIMVLNPNPDFLDSIVEKPTPLRR